MKKRVVITGVGILASNGKGKDEYWQALEDGRVGYKPVTLFDAGHYKTNIAGEISDFDASIYVGQKGLRNLDRSTKLLISAGRLAVNDCGINISEENSDDIGVACGTTLGSIKSISDFDKVALIEGPRSANPALFPNTVINSPSSQVSIWEFIQGFNTTIASGFTSSMDAMSFAYNFILWDKVKMVLAGGVEELCEQTFCGFHTLKFLSGVKEGEQFINCPFDKRRNGITFGEGACLLAFEELEHAKARGANIYAEVFGFGYAFDPFRINKYNPRGTGVKESIRHALKESNLEINDIDCIFANANSTQAADKIETEAIKEIFGKYAHKIPIPAVKSMVGECYSVSGALSVTAAVGSLVKGFIPPTVNYKERDENCDLDYVPNKSRKQKLDKILVVNFAPHGSCSNIVIGQYRK